MKIRTLIGCGFKNCISSEILLKLKLTISLLIAAFLQVNAEGYSQQINLVQKNVQLEEVFNKIMNQTDYLFLYPSNLLLNAKPVDINLKDASLEEALEQCFKEQDLTFVIESNTVVVRMKEPPPPTIKGKVTNTQGETLPGASISIENKNAGTITNEKGEYSLEIPTGLKGIVTLVASYVGYQTVKKTINIDNKQNITVNFELEPVSTSLGQIVISANKRSRTVLETPMAVQAMSAAKLKEVGARDLSEVINFVPGGSEVASSTIGERQYQLRGVPAIAGDATIGYYLDEASYNYYGSFYAPVSKSFDMERVEILRGPQSTLYGGGAMGGVIKYVPNKPNLQKVEGEADMGGSTLKGGDPGFYGDLAISAPIVKDKLAIRLNGGYEEVGGYIEGKDGQKNIDGGHIQQIRGSLLYQPISKLKINLTYQKNEFKQMAGTGLSSAAPPITMGDPRDFTSANTNWYIGSITYDFNNFASLTTTTSYIDRKSPSETTFEIAGLGTLNGKGYANATALTNETRLVSNTKGPFQWLAGVFYSNTDLTSGYEWNYEAFNNENVQTSKSYSAFGEFSYSFLDGKLTPLFGIRSFNDTRSFDYGANGGLQEEKFSSINPRFNIAYKPNRNQNYYINIAKGFRSGVFNNPVWLQVHIDQGLPGKVAVDSDKLWSFEVGTKQEVANNQVLIEFAAFYQYWKNMQSILPDALAGYFMIYQVGDVVVPGLDMAITYIPKQTTGLFFQLVANVNDAKYKKIDPELIALTGAENGDRINMVPAWNMGLNANYSWKFNSSEKWKGDAMVAFTHTAPQRGFPVTKIGDAQDILRARVGVQYLNYGFSIFGNNILNETGPLFIQETSALIIYNQTRPAQFGIELRAKF